MNPESVYRKRIEVIDLQLNKLKKIELVLSLLKLCFVVGGVFFLFRVALHYTLFALTGFLFFLVLFIFSVLVHEHYIRKRNFQRILENINRDEIQACHGAFLDYGNGSEFDDSDHEYTSDLGIFEERGVFHFLNRMTTSLGKKALSDWLKVFPGSREIEEIKSKQEAVKELSEKIDFRQNIQAQGNTIEDSLEKLQSVQDFFAESHVVLGKGAFIAFIHVFPLVTVASIVLVFFNFSWLFPVGLALVQGIVNRSYRKKVSRIYSLTAKNYKIMNVYSKIIAEIEKENFGASKLDELSHHFFVKSKPASFYIKKLASRFQYFEARASNMIHFLMNNIFFWDFHCIYRIEKWRVDLKPEIDSWFKTIGQFDAMASLGTAYFNHPDWCMPELFNDGFQIHASDVGHPLIPPSERICNSIELNGETNIAIITGPNMAGKTTLLKTIGVNSVLAFAGAPVCARRFVISPLRIYTSMKVSDSLDKGLSLFYAELQRLKMVLDAILRKEPVFFLIDEMLKGTNELDRHKGAIALIRQLIEHRAQGMVATHDLKLTKLEQDYPESIHNYYFDGYIKDDKLIFDYVLKKGICKSSNALELMKRIGIKV
ncbi:MAG: hypothetical protein PVF22_00410 [Candidatus Aminicenantes bacterium]|jgi:DNA mismatch repair ATPase MutS